MADNTASTPIVVEHHAEDGTLEQCEPLNSDEEEDEDSCFSSDDESRDVEHLKAELHKLELREQHLKQVRAYQQAQEEQGSEKEGETATGEEEEEQFVDAIEAPVVKQDEAEKEKEKAVSENVKQQTEEGDAAKEDNEKEKEEGDKAEDDSSTKTEGETEEEASPERDVFAAQREIDPARCLECKQKGNKHFGEAEYTEAIDSYTLALSFCPDDDHETRAVLFNNRAACYLLMNENQKVVDEAGLALQEQPRNLKALMRRARAYEAMEKYTEAVEDMKLLMEIDPSNREFFRSHERLEKALKDQQEKQKEEMLGKLKDLGNMFLGKFGLSLDNFQATPNPAGGYSINFNKK